MQDNSLQIQNFQQMWKWLGVWEMAQRYMYIFEHDINTMSVDALIRQCATGRIFLVYDSNPWQLDVKERLAAILDNANGNVRILSPDVQSLWNPDPRWVYFPRWFVSQRWQANHQNAFKPYRFGYLSGEVRFHRLWLHQHCRDAWCDQDAVMIHLKNVEHVRMDRDIDRYYDLDHSITRDLPFGTPAGRDDIDQKFAALAGSAGDHSNGHNAYAAAIHIVGETSALDDLVFFSEKTWKALRSHCLVMTLGSPDTCSVLQRLGFAVPDEIDRDLPLAEKVHWIADRVNDWDFDICQDLYHKYYREIEHNFQHFNGQTMVQLFHDDINRRLA